MHCLHVQVPGGMSVQLEGLSSPMALRLEEVEEVLSIKVGVLVCVRVPVSVCVLVGVGKEGCEVVGVDKGKGVRLWVWVWWLWVRIGVRVWGVSKCGGKGWLLSVL